MNKPPVTHRHRTALPFAALLMGGAAIGFAPILVRWSDVGPVASAFWRLALAAPLLWLWAAGAPSERVHRRGLRLTPALLTGLFFAGDLGVWHWSIAYTTVANATLLTNFAPIFVALGTWAMFRERLSRQLLFGMVTGLAGAMFLVGPHVGLGGTRLLGDALGVLTAVFYGGYLLAVKQARATFSTVTLMALSTTVSALVLLPIALLSPQPAWPANATGWAVVIALALITQILGQGLIVYAFAHLPATMSSVSLLIQPLVATVLAWWLFGEALGPIQFIGAALILAGIFLARRADSPT